MVKHVIAEIDTAEATLSAGDRLLTNIRLYRRALRYFREDWKLIAVWLAFIGLSTGVGLLSAWPMAVLLDSVLGNSGNQDRMHRIILAMLPARRGGQIVGLALGGLLLKFCSDLLGAAQTIVSNQVNYNGLLRVRCDLYRKLQAMSLAYHKSQPQGDAIYRLSSDTFGCQNILGVLVATAVALATLAVMTCVLAAQSLTLTLLSFSILPPLAITNIIYGQRLKHRSLECKERDSDFMTVVQRSMACIGLVQAFGREAEEFTQFRGTIHQNISAWWRLNREQITYNMIVGTLFGLGGAAIFGYGGWLAHRGTLSVGQLMIFTSYLGMIWGPLCALTGFASNVQGGVAGAQRVFDVLDRDPIISDAPDARPLPRQPRVLELDQVSFSYQAKAPEPVLKQVTARIAPGEMVAFVGSSGVGKSTLLNLLPRFYDPTGGAVRLDGIDVRDLRLADLRRHVALVLQESIILPTSIGENIAYGRPGASREQIIEAAKLAGAADFIHRMERGYDTVISEGGQNLSGGQRQRIAIARALLTEAPIVILDEPTSALDPIHERHITDTLLALKGKRTIIVVSHRLSTVRGCDQIFVMHGGAIVERGTHTQLLSIDGHYAQMAAAQLGEQPLRDAA